MERTIFCGQRIPRERVVLPTEEYYRRRNRASRRGRWLLFFVTALAVFVAALGTGAARAQQTVALDDVESGDLLFTGNEPGNYVPAVHLASRAHIAIRGLMAEVVLQQVFSNLSDDWQEALYVLPLPEQAAVSGLEIRVGERRIIGKVREREEAAKIYAEARAAGKRAALLEQQRPNLFTNKVANIAPGERIQVQVTFLQPVHYDGGKFSLRMPTTLTPRYIPGEAVTNTGVALAVNRHGWAMPTDQVPDAHKITPFMWPAFDTGVPSGGATQSDPESGGSGAALAGSHKIAIEVELDSGLPLADIDSPYHDIDVEKKADGSYGIRLRKGETEMDRDFALFWKPRPSAMPRAALFSQPAVSDGKESHYLQLLLLPPDTKQSARRLAREVVYVIDTSGSMSGVSIRQAKESLQLALSRLRPIDRFNVIEFNTSSRAFFPRPVAAEAANIRLASAQIEGLQASGGTEMAQALRLALSQQMPDADNLVHQVVFITDGAVGNERALFELIQQSLGDARLFTVGIGSAPNNHFMRKAAQFGRGAFVTIGDLSEVQQRMEALFTKLEHPLATDLQIQWPRGLVVDAYPKRIPDLYRGEPMQLVAKIEGALAGELQLRGRLAGRQFVQRLALKENESDGSGGLGSLWARAKIESLRDRQLQLGERSRAGEALRDEILQLALDHQLVSPYTSFVAVEEKIARPAADNLSTSAVPNAVARGQLLQQQTYPRTAAGLYAQLLAAMGLLSLAALLRRMRQVRYSFSRSLRRLLKKLVPDPRSC
ncbi:marine proteobacterial sortase target protein [Microbulbifer thermotolerans]|uniref:marine proteobacterial sortase target protein n=1 Tax=Microbulbifer thermotolerans TaxID=252514 RepID=UPI00224AAED7|nr:marine proteobacterial sortase target protein [Microbulbifer thermotolerans]MCX2835038.1 marine proteobacterial sortase target protein [Microbulbifer thermotolerans]MCX2841693.1 marine proteobacterial sortase target protein [Microbulbifer thermotolerans]